MVILESYIGYKLLTRKKKKKTRTNYSQKEDKSLSGRFARTLYGVSGGKK